MSPATPTCAPSTSRACTTNSSGAPAVTAAIRRCSTRARTPRNGGMWARPVGYRSRRCAAAAIPTRRACGPFGIPTDQYARYQTSEHGIRLAKGDDRVAVCTDCHGVHRILAPTEPTSPVAPANIPATCGHCHSNKALMDEYKLPSNQEAQYRSSVHGIALFVEERRDAPTCATCHGVHGAAVSNGQAHRHGLRDLPCAQPRSLQPEPAPGGDRRGERCRSVRAATAIMASHIPRAPSSRAPARPAISRTMPALSTAAQLNTLVQPGGGVLGCAQTATSRR